MFVMRGTYFENAMFLLSKCCDSKIGTVQEWPKTNERTCLQQPFEIFPAALELREALLPPERPAQDAPPS